MDAFTALRNELFRPLAAVVLPGAIALAPWVVIFADHTVEVANLYRERGGWFFAAYIGISVVVGLLLENIGSAIERGIDRCIECEYLPGHKDVWLAYLSGGTSDNNGRRFLAGIVTRLKFINSLMPALVVLCVGLLAIHLSLGKWERPWFLTFMAGMTVLQVWLFRTSTELSEVASATRYHLLDESDRPKGYKVDARHVRRHRHLAYVIGELVTSRGEEIDLTGKHWLQVLPISARLFWGKSA